jgi:hypothetical protein
MVPPPQTHMSSATQPQSWSNPEISVVATSVAGAQQSLSLMPTSTVLGISADKSWDNGNATAYATASTQ